MHVDRFGHQGASEVLQNRMYEGVGGTAQVTWHLGIRGYSLLRFSELARQIYSAKDQGTAVIQ